MSQKFLNTFVSIIVPAYNEEARLVSRWPLPWGTTIFAVASKIPVGQPAGGRSRGDQWCLRSLSKLPQI